MQSGQVASSSSGFMGAAAAVGSHTSVQLHATEVVAELVANISRGEWMYTVPADTACPAAS